MTFSFEDTLDQVKMIKMRGIVGLFRFLLDAPPLHATNMLFPDSSNHPSNCMPVSHNADTMPIFLQFYISVHPAAQHATLSRSELVDPPRQPLAHALLDNRHVLVAAQAPFRYRRLVGLIVHHYLG